MTVSGYQIGSVIKAYSKQNRMKLKPITPHVSRQEDNHSGDVVTLSTDKESNDHAYKLISYNLLDVILKTKEH